MRILASSLACSPTAGSEALVAYQAISALAEQYDISLVTSSGMHSPHGVDQHTLDVKFREPNDVSAWQLWRFERGQRRLVRRLLHDGKFDLVHRITPSGLKDSLLPLPGVPLVLGPILLADPPPPAFDAVFRPALAPQWSARAALRRLQHGFARRVFARYSSLNDHLEHAALIFVGTRTTLSRLPARYHARCRLITYAGVDHGQFRPAPGGRPNRVPKLLFVGRIVPYKGVELLIRAAAKARDRCAFELTLVGSGDPRYLQYCKALADTLNLQERVAFLPHQPREALVNLYQSADIFCMPSIETYGIAILEAMACGCAVLASDINGPGEIVQPGTGQKVPLETPEQFIEQYAERIVELATDERLRRELGEAARQHVERHHDWRRIRERLLAIYDEFFPQSAGRPATAPLAVSA